MTRGGRALTAGLVTLGVVAAVAIAVHQGIGPLPDAEGCRAEVAGHTAALDTEQAENAALITAIAVRRGLPPRAASIALATAMQESKLRNIEHGDRDSLGLFQQRPSQGWGTQAQILNPVYADQRLLRRPRRGGRTTRTMSITEAAQAVQRSAYPDAYAEHEADARALASALTGETAGGAFTCVVQGDFEPAPARLNARGLTGRGRGRTP